MALFILVKGLQNMGYRSANIFQNLFEALTIMLKRYRMMLKGAYRHMY
jgi:hypothetical protein